MALSTGFTLAELLSTLPQVGRWNGSACEARAPMRIPSEAEIETDKGLIGDRSAAIAKSERLFLLSLLVLGFGLLHGIFAL